MIDAKIQTSSEQIPKRKDLSLLYFKISILLLVYQGAWAWFTWNFNFGILCIVTSFFSISFASTHRLDVFKLDNYFVGFLLLALAFTYIRVGYTPLMLLGTVAYICPLYVLAKASNYHKTILNFIIRVTCWILVPSLLLHIIFLLLGYPSFNIINHSASTLYMYYNYFVLVHNFILPDYSIRFSSIFLEPGYAATLFVFLLYANNFDLKDKYNRIILIGLIFTLSLAGYIIIIIIYVFNSIQHGLFKKKYIFGLGIIGLLYISAVNYNNGQNILNKYIVERIDIDGDDIMNKTGRNTRLASEYFELFIADGTIWKGIGDAGIAEINGGTGDYSANIENQILGAGFIIFFIRYGFLTGLLVFLSYIFLGCTKSKQYLICFLSVIVITFIQAAYPFSFAWLIPYILGGTPKK